MPETLAEPASVERPGRGRSEPTTEHERRVADIDEVLAFTPAHAGTGAVTEVCARMKACIARVAPPSSVYRAMADDVSMPSGNGNGREDMRLGGILRAMRHDLVTMPAVASGDAGDAAWLASAAAMPGDQFASHAALLSIVERGFALGREARVLVLMARHPSTRSWSAVFGRIDMIRPGDVPPVTVRPRAPVRLVEERPEPSVLLPRLASAVDGRPFTVGDVPLVDHGMDGQWRGERYPENGLRYGTLWPNVVLCSGEIKSRPYIDGAIEADGPQSVFMGLDALAWQVSGFRPSSDGRADLRILRIQVVLWDYRGRLECRSTGTRFQITVVPPGDPSLRLVAIARGESGRDTPLTKDAPGNEEVVLDERVVEAKATLRRGEDVVVEHSFSAAREAWLSQHGAADWGGQFGDIPSDAPESMEDVTSTSCVDSVSPIDRAPDGLQAAPTTYADSHVAEALSLISADVAECYRQALSDLADPKRTSFVGVAAEVREVLTAVLHARAPDDRVRAEPWFSLDPNANGPTRAQRVRHILESRSESKAKSATEAFDVIEQRLPHLTKELYARASRGTHLAPTDRSELLTLVSYWQGLLRDLLLG